MTDNKASETQFTEMSENDTAAHGSVGHVHGPGCSHGHATHDPFVRASDKIGRNDLCPCGSQQKFKKCHGK